MPEEHTNKARRGKIVPPRLRYDELLPDLLTIAEAAAILRKSKEGLRRMCKEGRFPAKRMGHEWRIERRQIEAYIQNLPDAGPSATNGHEPEQPLLTAIDQELD